MNRQRPVKLLAALAVLGLGLGAAPAMAQYTPGFGPSYIVQPTLPPAPTAYPQPTYSAPTLSPAQIDQLTASIALYPDPLLATVLSASADGPEIAAAALPQSSHRLVPSSRRRPPSTPAPVAVTMVPPAVLSAMAIRATA